MGFGLWAFLAQGQPSVFSGPAKGGLAAPTNNATAADGQVISKTGDQTKWVSTSNIIGGTVSSVGLAMPAGFAVSGSPVTAAGTLTATLPSLVVTQGFDQLMAFSNSLLVTAKQTNLDYISFGGDTFIQRSNAANTFLLGLSGGISGANQTIDLPEPGFGLLPDLNAGGLTFNGGRSSGLGTPGEFVFNVGTNDTSSGSAPNALVERLRIGNSTTLIRPGQVGKVALTLTNVPSSTADLLQAKGQGATRFYVNANAVVGGDGSLLTNLPPSVATNVFVIPGAGVSVQTNTAGSVYTVSAPSALLFRTNTGTGGATNLFPGRLDLTAPALRVQETYGTNKWIEITNGMLVIPPFQQGSDAVGADGSSGGIIFALAGETNWQFGSQHYILNKVGNGNADVGQLLISHQSIALEEQSIGEVTLGNDGSWGGIIRIRADANFGTELTTNGFGRSHVFIIEAHTKDSLGAIHKAFPGIVAYHTGDTVDSYPGDPFGHFTAASAGELAFYSHIPWPSISGSGEAISAGSYSEIFRMRTNDVHFLKQVIIEGEQTNNASLTVKSNIYFGQGSTLIGLNGAAQTKLGQSTAGTSTKIFGEGSSFTVAGSSTRSLNYDGTHLYVTEGAGLIDWGDQGKEGRFAYTRFVTNNTTGLDLNTTPGTLIVFTNLTLSGSGVFTGNGSGITALNASSLASGTVPIAALGNALTNNNVNAFTIFTNNGVSISYSSSGVFTWTNYGAANQGFSWNTNGNTTVYGGLGVGVAAPASGIYSSNTTAAAAGITVITNQPKGGSLYLGTNQAAMVNGGINGTNQFEVDVPGTIGALNVHTNGQLYVAKGSIALNTVVVTNIQALNGVPAAAIRQSADGSSVGELNVGNIYGISFQFGNGNPATAWQKIVGNPGAGVGVQVLSSGGAYTNMTLKDLIATNTVTATNGFVVPMQTLASTSNQTNYTVSMLGDAQIITANTNANLTVTTPAAFATTTVLFNCVTSTVDCVITLPANLLTNVNLNLRVTNGWARALNFYSIDGTSTNILVSDSALYHR